MLCCGGDAGLHHRHNQPVVNPQEEQPYRQCFLSPHHHKAADCAEKDGIGDLLSTDQQLEQFLGLFSKTCEKQAEEEILPRSALSMLRL